MEEVPYSSTLRSSATLALVAVFSLLAACGGGGSVGPAGVGNPSNLPTPGVTLEWDTPQGGSIVGFKVYYGTAPGTYIQPPGQGVDVRLVNSYSLAGLNSGTTYYFAVTAYDQLNDESGYSNEISTLIP